MLQNVTGVIDVALAEALTPGCGIRSPIADAAPVHRTTRRRLSLVIAVVLVHRWRRHGAVAASVGHAVRRERSRVRRRCPLAEPLSVDSGSVVQPVRRWSGLLHDLTST